MAQKPRKRKSIILRVCIFAFVLYAAVLLVDMQVTIANRKLELEQLQQQCRAQHFANVELERQLEIGIDKGYIERVAREKLDFVEPDEQVFIDISGN